MKKLIRLVKPNKTNKKNKTNKTTNAIKTRFSKIKLIIFDFDDTLEDFTSAELLFQKNFSNELYKQYKIPTKKTIKIYRKINAKNVDLAKITLNPKYLWRHDWFFDLFSKLKINKTKNEIDLVVKNYWNFILENVTIFSHTKNTLKNLSKKYDLVILSDGDGTKKLKLDRINKFKISKYFSKIYTSEDTLQSKPSQHNYFFILKQFNVLPSECMMVGDKPEIDLITAKKLGFSTVWMQQGFWAKKRAGKKFSYVDYKIKDLRQLEKILKTK